MRKFEFLIEKGFFFAAAMSALVVVLIFVFILYLSLPLLYQGHLLPSLAKPWMPQEGLYGVYPMIIGTAAVVFFSLCWAFPLSLGTSVLISVIRPKGFGGALRKTVIMMTAIPTVVYGFVGVFLLAPLIQTVFAAGSGMSILTASLMLALLICPTMILIFTDTLESVPHAYCEAVDALGGSPVQKLCWVLLPCSWRGIVTGLILGTGRAVGDTLIALMLAGNAVAVPGSIFESARTLTAHIALVTAADFDSVEFRTIFVCGILLYLVTLSIILTARLMTGENRDRLR